MGRKGAHAQQVQAADERLGEAHEATQTLLGSIRDGFMSLDRAWRILYVNERQASVLGAPVEALLGRSLWEFLPEPDGGIVHQELGRALRERVPVAFQYFDERLCRWFEKRAYPMGDGISCLTSDITVRKRSETRLAVENAVARVLSESRSVEAAVPALLPQLCKVLEAQVAAVWMIEPQGKELYCAAMNQCDDSVEAGRFAAASRQVRFLSGVSLPGRVWSEGRSLWLPDLQKESNLTRKAMAIEAGLRSAVAFPISSGGEFFGVVELFLRRFCEDDATLLETTSALGSEIAQFIQRKRAEAALQAAQAQLREHAQNLEELVTQRTSELRETVSELEAFSYSLSHDMRSSLRAIQGFTQVALDEAGERLGASGTELLGKVLGAAQRLDQLIRDVLTLTRIPHNELSFTAIDPERLAGEIISERPELQPPQAEVSISGPLLPVRGDRASLMQCLSNLLANAVKFVAPGVQPRVRLWTEARGERFACGSQITGWVSAGRTRASSSSSLPAFTPVVNTRAMGWAWPSCAAPPNGWAERWASNPNRGTEPASGWSCHGRIKWTSYIPGFRRN